MFTVDEMKVVLDRAYESLLDSINKRQQRLAFNAMLNDLSNSEDRNLVHGTLLPTRKVFRNTHRHESFKRRKERVARELEFDRDGLKREVSLLVKLEEALGKLHEANDERWAAAMADHFRNSKKGK